MAEMAHGDWGAQAGWPTEVEGAGLLATMATGQVAQTLELQGEPQQHCAVADCDALSGELGYELNGRLACSRQCLELLLRQAVIEESMRATAAALKGRPRVLLGRILIEQGIIDEGQLDQALRAQRATGAGRLGCWLKQQVELPEADFTAALSIQWHCPVFRLGNFIPARMVSYLPRPLMEDHGAVSLRTTGSPQRLSLCFEDHLDYELMHAAERMHGLSVEAGLLTATEFWQAMRDMLSVRFPSCISVESASPDCMAEAMSQLLVQAGAVSARMTAVHGCYWLRFWKAADSEAASSEPIPYDVLCTPQAALAGNSAGEDSVASLAAAMLRVLG